VAVAAFDDVHRSARLPRVHRRRRRRRATRNGDDDAGDDDNNDAGLALARLLPMLVQPIIAIAQGGTPAQVKAAKRVLKDAKKALYAILADDDSDEGDAEGGA
jgi:hypothetical protein